ncbi:nucleotidyltransferase domain-containing protein [Thermodesulfovibrio hydrogeniphilus]
MLFDAFEKILEKTLEALKECYKERLVSVVIYGSVGRQTQRFDSDVDLLIVVEDLPKGRFARLEEFECVEKMIEPVVEDVRKIGVQTYLSPVIKTPEEVIKGSLLFLDMVEDAKILYDRDNFFEKFLESFREKLNKLGARRIKRGSSWYWELKPDYKPDEVFEI